MIEPTETETLPAPPPPLRLVDRDGETWESAGRTPDGDVLLVCPEPSLPEDRGDGESFPWTLASVGSWFGPLRVLTGGAA